MKKEKLSEIGIPSKIEKLKRFFPEYFDKEGRFLIEKFKEDIQNQTDISKETYSLEWLGKSYAKVLANEPVRTLLKENKEWNEKNNSQNVLIKGDNLEVLKHLVNAYERDIKMIYIDPPYNTGNDGFVYEDDRKFTPYKLSKLAGIDIEKAKRILDFVNSKSNSHSAWLTFMYPRLYIARRLLKDDGVIFVSIDDNEVAQLRILMDEIFGEENFVGLLSVENNPKGRKNSDFISVSNDYCLIYAKNREKSYFVENIPKNIKDMTQDENGNYIHNSGKRVLVGENSFNKEVTNFDSLKHYSVYYNKKSNDLKIRKEQSINEVDNRLIKEGYKRYISIRNNNFIENTYTIDKFVKLFNEGALEFKGNKIFEKNFNSKIRMKSIVKNAKYDAIIDNKVKRYEIDVKTTAAKTNLKKLFGFEVFSNPKNINFLKLLISLFDEKKFIVLDFFAGSGTTGDAVMQLNAEDGGSRKFILVQLPEPIDPKKSKTAYDFVKNELKKETPTIFDITKERLIRAAKKIQKEHKDKEWIDKLDLSFKEFETIPMPDENLKDIEELEEVDLFKEISDKNALLTTWKVFDGIKLHKDLKEMDFNGYKGYYLENKLYLVDSGFSLDNLAAILERIDKDNNFLPSKIVINGYVFDSKTQREIYESINNYNKKDLDKIELIVRY